MADIARIAVASAHAFRVGREAEGHQLLAGVIDGLAPQSTHAAIRAIEPALMELFAAQKRGDTLRIADVLEFVIAPACEAMAGTGR
jgi:hypothetical protein